jgi:hypothetical protein
MDNGERSLRGLVDKWIGLSPLTPGRVFRMSRKDAREARCVCVEVRRASGPLSLMFFQHGDGSWCVFPPTANRPTLRPG